MEKASDAIKRERDTIHKDLKRVESKYQTYPWQWKQKFRINFIFTLAAHIHFCGYKLFYRAPAAPISPEKNHIILHNKP